MPNHNSGAILPIGQTLIHQYEIIKVLGVGGFGITYLSKDIRLMQLVAIKEFFPETICVREADGKIRAKSRHQLEVFEKFKSRFVDEGRTLAKFKHPNMVRVQNYFEANGTAY